MARTALLRATLAAARVARPAGVVWITALVVVACVGAPSASPHTAPPTADPTSPAQTAVPGTAEPTGPPAATGTPTPTAHATPSATKRPAQTPGWRSALVTIETHGGLCPYGPCREMRIIERDGRVHATEPQPENLGRLPVDILASLERAIDEADFARLSSRPFTGVCPTAYDGREAILTFATDGGDVRLASCDVEIDPSDPLFVALQAALEAVGAG